MMATCSMWHVVRAPSLVDAFEVVHAVAGRVHRVPREVDQSRAVIMTAREAAEYYAEYLAEVDQNGERESTPVPTWPDMVAEAAAARGRRREESDRGAPPKSPVTHELKCESRFFQALWDGRKPFELREHDREYRIGDVLNLHEVRPEHPWETEATAFTGRRIEAPVTYALADERWLKPGVVALGLGERRTFTGPASLPAPTRAGHHECPVAADLWEH